MVVPFVRVSLITWATLLVLELVPFRVDGPLEVHPGFFDFDDISSTFLDPILRMCACIPAQKDGLTPVELRLQSG